MAEMRAFGAAWRLLLLLPKYEAKVMPLGDAPIALRPYDSSVERRRILREPDG